MHKNYIIQGDNLILDEKLTNISGNVHSIYISKKITECTCPSCHTKTKRIHDHRFQKIKHLPINGYETYLYLKKLVYFVLIVVKNSI